MGEMTKYDIVEFFNICLKSTRVQSVVFLTLIYISVVCDTNCQSSSRIRAVSSSKSSLEVQMNWLSTQVQSSPPSPSWTRGKKGTLNLSWKSVQLNFFWTFWTLYSSDSFRICKSAQRKPLHKELGLSPALYCVVFSYSVITICPPLQNSPLQKCPSNRIF